MFDSADLNEDQLSLLEEIYEIYGHMPAFKLSDITHESNGPWDVASREYGFFAPIGNDLIRSHYKQKRETAKKRK
ncbi:hypothetical protein PSJ8397_02237 [Pseudooctadecabacter jejudonensis]|uniref:Antitoxin SocA-like Panacea domain-containing protein n=2 Tax=Pseudooctadecabacter jejudonensis TaxID=1391910 RepID=A0A1Y5SMG5_9RHOB|nr:hypothetical protein PSJ8397_02237 [Pseudooctadecabacter jejudonensis]